MIELIELVGLVVAFIAYFRVQRTRHDVARLQQKLDRLSALMEASPPSSRPQREAPETHSEPSLPFPKPAKPEERPEPPPTTVPFTTPSSTPPLTAHERAEASEIPRPSLEESITSRWMVWLGSVALAFGGIFLIKYSIDQGLLGPATRVSLAGLVGVGLVVLGEWVRQRPLQRALAQLHPDYVPPALCAAGLTTLFGAAYAAYGLYDLIPPALAFIFLAAIAVVGLGLSLLQGPLIAAIGLAGAYLNPALVSTGNSSAAVLFSYLFFVNAAAFAILYYKNWWWLAALTIAAALGWPMLWVIGPFALGDAAVLVTYLLGFILSLIALAYLHASADQPLPENPRIARIQRSRPYIVSTVSSYLAFAVLFFVFDANDFARTTTLALWLLSGLCLIAGRRVDGLLGLSIGAAALVFVSLFVMPIGNFDLGNLIDPWSLSGRAAPLPETITDFLWLSSSLALLYAVFGYWTAGRNHRPGYWAALSSALPIGILLICYYRIADLQPNLIWGLTATGLAVLALVAAERSATRQQKTALAAYSIAVSAALSLAFTMVLREAWLTVALAVQLPVIARLYEKVPFVALRRLALVLGVIVLFRLVANWNIFGYAIAPTPIVNWLLYGYGLPALCFYFSAKWFLRDKDDLTVQVLEGGAFAFGVLLVTFEIRHWANSGSLTTDYFDLFEVSLQSISWLLISLSTYWRARRRQRHVINYGQKILFALACLQIAFLQLIILNPVFDGQAVGSWPILNTLLLAYGLPSFILITFAYIARGRQENRLKLFSSISGLALFFVYISLEVRHAFHGAILTGATRDAELYAYSVAWLVYGCALMALGLWTRHQAPRHAALVIILLTVAKVFLIDMSTLTGLYRVLSFFGLGGSLVGIGYFYQRVIIANTPNPQPAQSGDEQIRPS